MHGKEVYFLFTISAMQETSVSREEQYQSIKRKTSQNRVENQQVHESILLTLIEKDHLGDWSLEKDCCLSVLLRTPITHMIFFNQGMLLLGSKPFS